MLRPPQRRLDEVVRPRERRGQHQTQDFREWIQYLGMLTWIGKGGEVIQQGDAGRGGHRQASIDEAPYESDFQPRRKLPPLFKRLPWRVSRSILSPSSRLLSTTTTAFRPGQS